MTTARSNIQLTPTEKEQARLQALKVMQMRLEQRKPDARRYELTSSAAMRVTIGTLTWSRAFIPLIALLAGLASSVRTIQTASEIYAASGSHPIGVLIAAIAFTLSVEGALFVLALATEGERLEMRRQSVPRHVTSLRSVWRAIRVRLGLAEPVGYAELPRRSGLGPVTLLALMFAVAANANLGLRPLIEEIGTVSLQVFFSQLVVAPAALQLKFLVDVAGMLFPPLMALAAGHLTARYAVEIAERTQAAQTAFAADLEAWRRTTLDPLESDEGQAVLEMYTQEKLRVKANRLGRSPDGQTDFLAQGNGHIMA